MTTRKKESGHDGNGFTFITTGDMLAQVLPDGAVRVGTVKEPGRANRGAALRPRIDWHTRVPMELVKAMAVELHDDLERERISEKLAAGRKEKATKT